MNKTEEYMFGTNNYESIEDDFDNEEKNFDKRKLIIVGEIALIALLLITSIIGLFTGVRYGKLIKQKEAQIVEIQKKLESADKQIVDLANQLAILKTENPTTDVAENATVESKQMTALAGLKVRKNPSLDAEYTETKLDIKGINSSDGIVLMDEGTKFAVLETKTVDENTWIRIGTDAWICSNYQGEQLAE